MKYTSITHNVCKIWEGTHAIELVGSMHCLYIHDKFESNVWNAYIRMLRMRMYLHACLHLQKSTSGRLHNTCTLICC